MKLTTHATLLRGESSGYDSLLNEVLPHNDLLRQGLLASDMDGTMFKEDLGVLVFVKKLKDPSFWNFTPESFKKLMLPKRYRVLANQGLDGGIENLPASACREILNLTEDLEKLYTLQKNLVESGEKFGLADPFVSEFALRMLAFDDLFMEYDKVFMPLVGGHFLSRTRFFAGKKVEDIKQIAREIASTNQAEEVNFQPNAELAKDLSLTYQGETPKNNKFFLGLTVREDIFSLINRLKTETLLAQTAVVTANLQATASATVEATKYKTLFLPGNRWGSRLQKSNNGRLHPEMETIPVYGAAKVSRIKEESNSGVMIALGDTNGDIPMLVESLKNKGLAFFVVGDRNPEEARAYVRDQIKTALKISTIKRAQQSLGKGWEERLIYVLGENA